MSKLDDFIKQLGVEPTGEPKRYVIPEDIWRGGIFYLAKIPPLRTFKGPISEMPPLDLVDFQKITINLDLKKSFQIHEIPGIGEVVFIRYSCLG